MMILFSERTLVGYVINKLAVFVKAVVESRERLQWKLY